MPNPLTLRDITESISGLRSTANDLRRTKTTAINAKGGLVSTVRVDVLVRHADYLDQVADELTTLIPKDPVFIPPDLPTVPHTDS